MKKSFLYTALGLIGIMGALSIGVVSAEDTTQWVEGVDFHPLDIKASDGETVLFTIMDRNLGATEPGTGVNSYGYFYQWGNNYGFSSEYGTYPANTGTDLIDITGEGYGSGNYYSSDKFIIRTDSPLRWDTDESNETYIQYGNLNLWGGEHVYNSDADRQGPCPSGYHIPDTLERKTAKDLWCKEKMNNVNCVNGDIFRDDLLLPAAGLRDSYSAGIYYQNHNSPYNYAGNYWSSSPSPGSAGASFVLKFEQLALISQSTLGRTYGCSVRCFKNSEDSKTLTFDVDNGEDNIIYNIRWWEPITEKHRVEPKKDGYRFLGRYEGDTEFNFSDTTFITGDTVLKAKWEKFPWYTYDANGGVFSGQSSQNIIKYIKTFESSELAFGNFGFKKIEGAVKMHVEFVKIPSFMSTPRIYIYDYEKDNSTIGDDYIMSGTQATLTGDISIDGDTVGFVVTAYLDGSGPTRIFKIIGESDYVTSGVVIQPTREGYSFSGWYVIENEVEVDFDPEADNQIEDKTIYARWGSNGQAITTKYKISFDTDGGNQIEAIEVESGSAIDANSLPIPVKSCNEFAGWDGLVATMPGNDITLKAKWNYTCNKSSGGGGRRSSSNSDSKTHNAASDETVDSQNVNSDFKDLDMEKYDDRYPTEWNRAYQFAYKNLITTMDSIEKADLEFPLTRIAMAKMLSRYAINVLGKKPANIVVPNFVDITDELDEEYDSGISLAYQLGIMGINMPDNKFRPFDEVPRGEFGTALSRMLFGTKDGEDVYYSTHIAELMGKGIITNDDPYLIELRGYVMIMLMRSAKN